MFDCAENLKACAGAFGFLFFMSCGPAGFAAEEFSTPAARLDAAWQAWRDGDIDRAGTLGKPLCNDRERADSARHLLAFVRYARGDYEGFLALERRISQGYDERDKLARPGVEALKHLGRPQEALEFAKAHAIADERLTQTLELMAGAPISTALDRSTIIPFTEDALSQLLPGFDIEINGVKTTARLDTGGVFLNMSIATAEKLGIKTSACREASASLTKTQSCFGVARAVTFGDATLRNVPVHTAETLTADALGVDGAVVIGTNFLERFLVTIDYGGKRMILSPRGDKTAARAHKKLIGKAAAATPFYLWGDHFMFARGGVGDDHGLNFFIDSGLVAIAPDGRQAALLAAAEKAEAWGAVAADPESPLFRALPGGLALGTLDQPGHVVFVQPQAPISSLGGVRIDGLLSHAFLKNYAWTIDFDGRVFEFSK